VAATQLLTEIEDLKIIYKEIIDGCSLFSSFYVKHLTELEHIEIIRKRLEFYQKYTADGVPTESEKLQQLIDSEAWTKDLEEQILELKYIISDNEKNLPKLIPQQQPLIQRVVKEKKEKLNLILTERLELIGATANEFAEKEGFSYYLYLSLYNDKECKDRVFKNFSDLENIETEELSPYIRATETSRKNFSEVNIKRISCLPFFLNSFSYSKENITTFLGKPIAFLTPFQIHLFSLGTRNMNILTQSDGEPPELLDDTKIDDLVLWYDQQYSVILGKQKTTRR
jgi:hypothetical protein